MKALFLMRWLGNLACFFQVLDGPDVAELLMQHKANQIDSPAETDVVEDRQGISKKVALKQYREFLLQGAKQVATFVTFLVESFYDAC